MNNLKDQQSLADLQGFKNLVGLKSHEAKPTRNRLNRNALQVSIVRTLILLVLEIASRT